MDMEAEALATLSRFFFCSYVESLSLESRVLSGFDFNMGVVFIPGTWSVCVVFFKQN